MDLLRRWWAGETVDHHGPVYDFDGVTVGPTPVQDPLEIWLGGAGPRALERVGRLADGWLTAMLTPAEAAAGLATVVAYAERAGRVIDPEHFGISIPYARDEVPVDCRRRTAGAPERRRPRRHRPDRRGPAGRPGGTPHRCRPVQVRAAPTRPRRPAGWRPGLAGRRRATAADLNPTGRAGRPPAALRRRARCRPGPGPPWRTPAGARWPARAPSRSRSAAVGAGETYSRSNTCGRSSAAMPGPSSSTASSAPSPVELTDTWMDVRANFWAFSRRLAITWSNRSGSACTGTAPAGAETVTDSPSREASGSMAVIPARAACTRSTSDRTRENDRASRRARSSRSVTRRSSRPASRVMTAAAPRRPARCRR